MIKKIRTTDTPTFENILVDEKKEEENLMRESTEITDEILYGKRSNQFKQMQG